MKYYFLILFGITTFSSKASNFEKKYLEANVIALNIKKDSLRDLKNSIYLDLLGKHGFIGINYGRKIINLDKVNLISSFGFGLHEIHPYSLILLIKASRNLNEKFKIEFGLGSQITFGSDFSYGYDSYYEFRLANPEVGPAGTQFWYRKKEINYISEFGVIYSLGRKMNIGLTGNILFVNSYLGLNNRGFRLWGGISIGFNF